MTEIKYCPRCENILPLSEWVCNKARRDGLSTYCRSCHNKLNDDIRRQRRKDLIENLGSICVRCGFSDERALQVDHVYGSGNIQRKNGIGSNSVRFYKLVLANPDEYQLLCANCNAIKRIKNGEHRDTSSYTHEIPTTDRYCSPGNNTPESNVRRSEGLKRYWENADEDRIRCRERAKRYNENLTDEQKAEISAKISAARAGTKRGPDGKWIRPE